jgi:hypothetical protein
MSEKIKISLSKGEIDELLWLISNCKLDPAKFTPIPLRWQTDKFNEIKSEFFQFFKSSITKNPETSELPVEITL